MRHLESEVWNKGYDAYWDYIPRCENPYDEDTLAFDEWNEGWDSADSDCDDETGEDYCEECGTPLTIFIKDMDGTNLEEVYGCKKCDS